MMSFKAIGGGLFLALLAAVLFGDRFFIVLLIGIALLIILFFVRLGADLYWHGKNKGW